jgi:hypothetical protein
MHQSLRAAISHTFWHDLWTNATHDDRDFTIARMLAWQAYSNSTRNGPFKGRSLYALLMFGKLHSVLRSLPWKKPRSRESSWIKRFDPGEDLRDVQSRFPAHRLLQSVREYMGQLVDRIVSLMTTEQREEFVSYWGEIRAYYTSEFNARAEYNTAQPK